MCVIYPYVAKTQFMEKLNFLQTSCRTYGTQKIKLYSDYFYIFMLCKRCLGVFENSFFCVKIYEMIEKHPYYRNCLCVMILWGE